jgi:hypothetical protein
MATWGAGWVKPLLVPEKFWRFPIQNDQQLWTFDEFVVTHLGTMAIKPQTNQQVN